MDVTTLVVGIDIARRSRASLTGEGRPVKPTHFARCAVRFESLSFPKRGEPGYWMEEGCFWREG